MARERKANRKKSNAKEVNPGFEEKLWQAAAIRDALLPKLLSGKIRVGNGN